MNYFTQSPDQGTSKKMKLTKARATYVGSGIFIAVDRVTEYILLQMYIVLQSLYMVS